jgi:hypothetical protein
MNHRRFARLLTLALLPLGACGGDDGPSLEELTRPLIYWEHRVGVCSRYRAADSEKRLWASDGCENGSIVFTEVRTLSESEAAQLTQRFADLRGGSNQGSATECTTPSRHRFVSEQKDGTRQEWRICGAAGSTQDLSNLPEPFLGIAQSMTQ